MNKCFNRMQTLKSSEDCDKFSKSVSYETLVIGATTNGTEYKQTRRLFLGSADKPLSAVGTLTSLLSNSAKVVEKILDSVITRRTLVRRGYLPEQGTHAIKESLFASVTCFMRLPRRIQRMLLVMTFPTFVLALLFTLITTSESRAECKATENNWIKSCYEWNPGEADNCGDGCTYTYDSVNHKLTVTATKSDAVVSKKGILSPHYYESGNFPTVSDIEIDGEFKSFGEHAFLTNKANIHGKDWVLIVNGTSPGASNMFEGNTVTGTVIVNDGQTKLGSGPWSRATFNGTLILPPTITSFSGGTLAALFLGADAKIYCGAENCEQLFSNIDCDEFEKQAGATQGNLCKTHKERLLSAGKLLAYPENCIKMWSTGCIKCKSDSFKLNDGYCDRMRYTPAEAAEVLRDDDTNEIVITFRK